MRNSGSRAGGGGGAIATFLGARSFFTLGGDCFIVASIMVSSRFINAVYKGRVYARVLELLRSSLPYHLYYSRPSSCSERQLAAHVA